MRIGTKVGLLVAGLVTAQAVTVAGTGYLLITEGARFGALVSDQSRDLNTVGNLTLERGEQNRAFAELALYGAPRPGESPAQGQARYDQFLAEYRFRQEQLSTRTEEALRLSDPALHEAATTFEGIQDQVSAVQESRLADIRAGSYDPQADVQTTELNREGELVLGQAIGHAHQSAAAGAAAQAADSQRLITLAGLVSLALMALSAIVAVIVSGRIVRPIRRLTVAAQRVASTELPRTMADIHQARGSVEAPMLTEVSSDTTGDELATLSEAINAMQHSAVDLAVQTRRGELAANETLVNLGRRNQSLLNRTLSYVGELERDERDPKVLANLFRLDHLTTRIRRNAESMLVLAGAEQGRMHTRPVAMTHVTRAALSEIEDYARVQVGSLDEMAVHGPHAADLSHLLAELLENATRFSDPASPVLLEGAVVPDGGYRLVVRDEGLGMSQDALVEANERIATAQQCRASTTVLGLHVVGRLAARRGVTVELRAGEVRGTVAVVELPAGILVESEALADEQPAHQPAPGNEPAPAAQPAADVEAPVVPVAVAAVAPAPITRPVPVISAVPVTSAVPVISDVSVTSAVPVTSPVPVTANAVADATAAVVGSTMPRQRTAPAEPRQRTAQSDGPRRRVRGAQMPDLGDSQAPEIESRDAATVGRQLAGLQSSVARARRDATRP